MTIEKNKIAEVLFNNPERISSEEIVHILSHLPDGDKRGEFQQVSNVKFDHNGSDLFESTNVEWEKVKEFDEFISNLISGPTRKKKISQAVEELYNRLEDPNERLKLSVYCMIQLKHAYKGAEGMDGEIKRMVKIDGKGDPKKMLREIGALRKVLDSIEKVIRDNMKDDY